MVMTINLFMHEPVLEPYGKFWDDDCPNYQVECFLGNWNPDWFEYDRLLIAPRGQKTTQLAV